MKIIDEKGKLFGIINVVDLLVLVAVLAALGGVGYKLFKPELPDLKDVSSPNADLKMDVRVFGVMPYIWEDLEHNSPVGERMVAGSEFVEGEIVDMQFEEYTQIIVTDDGRMIESRDGIRKNIIFTITAEVKKDTPVLKIGSQEVRVGRGFTVKTNSFEMNGSITSLEISDD